MHKGINTTVDEGQTPIIEIPEVMCTLRSSGAGFDRPGNASTEHETYLPVAFSVREDAIANNFSANELEVSNAVTALRPSPQSHHAQTFVAQPIPLDLRNAGRDPEKHDEINRQGVGVGESGDPAHTITTACVHGVAQTVPISFGAQMSVPQVDFDLNQTLQAKNPMAVVQAMSVRRLTPVECERLQGFPDKYTEIPWRGKADTPDGPRYKALGNSMAVPVMNWIGKRINQVEKILDERREEAPQ
jgi:DNA (cytosine-5)-methyltransferase 1